MFHLTPRSFESVCGSLKNEAQVPADGYKYEPDIDSGIDGPPPPLPPELIHNAGYILGLCEGGTHLLKANNQFFPAHNPSLNLLKPERVPVPAWPAFIRYYIMFMENSIVLEIFTVEEAAGLLNLTPETILEAIEAGELKVRDKYQIPGPVLSAWWKSRGGSAVVLEDYLDKVPWLPVLLTRATEVFNSRAAAREWLLDRVPALGGKTPLEYAQSEREGASEVLDLINRIDFGGLS